MTKHIMAYTVREKGHLHDKPVKENGKVPTKLGFSREEKYNKAIHLQRVEYLKSQDMNWFPLPNPRIKSNCSPCGSRLYSCCFYIML